MYSLRLTETGSVPSGKLAGGNNFKISGLSGSQSRKSGMSGRQHRCLGAKSRIEVSHLEVALNSAKVA